MCHPWERGRPHPAPHTTWEGVALPIIPKLLCGPEGLPRGVPLPWGQPHFGAVSPVSPQAVRGDSCRRLSPLRPRGGAALPLTGRPRERAPASPRLRVPGPARAPRAPPAGRARPRRAPRPRVPNLRALVRKVPRLTRAPLYPGPRFHHAGGGRRSSRSSSLFPSSLLLMPLPRSVLPALLRRLARPLRSAAPPAMDGPQAEALLAPLRSAVRQQVNAPRPRGPAGGARGCRRGGRAGCGRCPGLSRWVCPPCGGVLAHPRGRCGGSGCGHGAAWRGPPGVPNGCSLPGAGPRMWGGAWGTGGAGG